MMALVIVSAIGSILYYILFLFCISLLRITYYVLCYIIYAIRNITPVQVRGNALSGTQYVIRRLKIIRHGIQINFAEAMIMAC